MELIIILLIAVEVVIVSGAFSVFSLACSHLYAKVLIRDVPEFFQEEHPKDHPKEHKI